MKKEEYNKIVDSINILRDVLKGYVDEEIDDVLSTIERFRE